MSKRKATINFRILALAISFSLSASYMPAALAADGELNFKVYSPESNRDGNENRLEGGRIQPSTGENSSSALTGETNTTTPQTSTPASSDGAATPQSSTTSDTAQTGDNTSTGLSSQTPTSDSTSTSTSTEPTSSASEKEAPAATEATSESKSDSATSTTSTSTDSPSTSASTSDAKDDSILKSETPSEGKSDTTENDTKASTDSGSSDSATTKSDGNKVLKGYVQVVPTGTKIPIIMDTAVDSDTSQEGDEFSARTSEDLTIDGSTAVPAGSIIRGRIATINAPKHMIRSGSVALKFDTITTPDNRQIPLVANLVARGGVVHARRGLKDVAIDTSIAGLPILAGLGIGAVAGNSGSSKIGVGGGALIGAGIGCAVGVAILLAKKGKKVDVRPGDELKIELAEDLHMPTM